MPFDRDAREHQVDLVVVVAVAPEILDDPQTAVAVGYGGVQVVLLACGGDGEAFLQSKRLMDVLGVWGMGERLRSRSFSPG